MRSVGNLGALRAEHSLEPLFAQGKEARLDLVARRPQYGLEVAESDLLLLLVPRDRVVFLRQIGLELLVRAHQVESLLVELRGLRAIDLAELVAIGVPVDHREARLRRAQGQLVALELDP